MKLDASSMAKAEAVPATARAKKVERIVMVGWKINGCRKLNRFDRLGVVGDTSRDGWVTNVGAVGGRAGRNVSEEEW